MDHEVVFYHLMQLLNYQGHSPDDVRGYKVRCLRYLCRSPHVGWDIVKANLTRDLITIVFDKQ